MAQMQIDYNKLGVLLLPTILRGGALQAIVQVCMLPLSTLHDTHQSRRTTRMFELQHTSSICHIKDALNHEFMVGNYVAGGIRATSALRRAYQLSYLAGDNVIIRNSTASQSGLCIYGGELLPLTGTPAKYIFVNSAQQSVTANGETFDNVRTTRTAIYTDANMGKPVSAFATLIDLVTLKNQLTYLQTQRRKPKV